MAHLTVVAPWFAKTTLRFIAARLHIVPG